MEWAGIRGAMDEIVRMGHRGFSLGAKISGLDYLIEVCSDEARHGQFRVTREELERFWMQKIFTSHPRGWDPVSDQDDETHLLLRMAKTGRQKKYGARIAVRPDQPALTQLQEHKRVVRAQKSLAYKALEAFASMRFLDLVPDRMREAAFPGQTVLGDGGENLPTVLREICADPQKRRTLAEWTRELTPMDVQDFEFPSDPTTGRVQLVIKETNGRKVSAYGASDGTLRFLAMLAALLGKNPARLYVFEEIDNGIHPSRLSLLVDLIERQTAKSRIQVVATTHSPGLLDLLSDQTFRNTSVVYRDEDSSDAIIRSVSDLPKAGELRSSQGLGRLHTGGWMETALAFTEGNNNEKAIED